MTTSEFPPFLFSILQAVLNGFFVAGLGALLALAFHIAFGSIKAVPKFGLYLKHHVSSLIFSVVGIYRNYFHHTDTLLKVIPFDAAHTSPSRVVIIPGTWSHWRYQWKRWQEYTKGLQRCNYEVYKFRWYASNSENSRQKAAKFLREWLDNECDGVGNVVLIGHSYGGIVAAQVGDHHLVSDVITLAAPFISTSALQDEQKASGALALFTRAFLLPTIIWLVYSASNIYREHGIIGITRSYPDLDIYACFAGAGSFVAYCIYVIVRLFLANSRPALDVPLPAPAANGASVICVQVEGDTIVNELEKFASSPFAQAEVSQSFLRQASIQPRALRKWALPYYIACVLVLTVVYAFPQAATIFEVLANNKANHTLQALLGYFVFIVYIIFIRTFAEALPALRDIKDLLIDLSKMVDWDAMAQDNRRALICVLAGLPLRARLVHSVDIRADLPDATIWKVDLPNSPTGLHKHSDVIGDEAVTLRVIDWLCSRIKHNGNHKIQPRTDAEVDAAFVG